MLWTTTVPKILFALGTTRQRPSYSKFIPAFGLMKKNKTWITLAKTENDNSGEGSRCSLQHLSLACAKGCGMTVITRSSNLTNLDQGRCQTSAVSSIPANPSDAFRKLRHLHKHNTMDQDTSGANTMIAADTNHASMLAAATKNTKWIKHVERRWEKHSMFESRKRQKRPRLRQSVSTEHIPTVVSVVSRSCCGSSSAVSENRCELLWMSQIFTFFHPIYPLASSGNLPRRVNCSSRHRLPGPSKESVGSVENVTYARKVDHPAFR